MGKKFKELKSKSQETQVADLNKLREELSKLRMSKVTTGPQVKRSKIGGIRKQVAQLLTCINTNKVETAKKEYKDSKRRMRWAPLNFRPKLSRKLRQALTKRQLALKTTRQYKRESNFPQRKFALLA